MSFWMWAIPGIIAGILLIANRIKPYFEQGITVGDLIFAVAYIALCAIGGWLMLFILIVVAIANAGLYIHDCWFPKMSKLEPLFLKVINTKVTRRNS